jgi:hypothetical protein
MHKPPKGKSLEEASRTSLALDAANTFPRSHSRIEQVGLPDLMQFSTEAAPGHPGPREGHPMRAILRTGFGGPEVLVIREIPEPEPKDGHVVIQIKWFGLNHAELHMRQGNWAEIADVRRHRVRRDRQVLPRR